MHLQVRLIKKDSHRRPPIQLWSARLVWRWVLAKPVTRACVCGRVPRLLFPFRRLNAVHRACRILAILTLGASLWHLGPRTATAREQLAKTIEAEVIIAGGSTAALAAAFAAAEQGVKTVLIEPTDWIGGQLTASGVPAVDEAWHRVTDEQTGEVLNVAKIARDPRNMTPAFRDTLQRIGNPGRGWVSRFCFEPKTILNEHLIPWECRLADRLKVYRQTVVKSIDVDPDTGLVRGLTAIRRLPRGEDRRGWLRSAALGGSARLVYVSAFGAF